MILVSTLKKVEVACSSFALSLRWTNIQLTSMNFFASLQMQKYKIACILLMLIGDQDWYRRMMENKINQKKIYGIKRLDC